LRRIFKETLSKVRFKLQQSAIEVSSKIKGLAPIMNLEAESTESKKAFYIISLMLLISLIFLSPDKILQTFTPTQADIGIFEKAQAITKVIKKIHAQFWIVLWRS